VKTSLINSNSQLLNGRSVIQAKDQITASSSSFYDMLGKAVQGVNNQLVQASHDAAKMAAGKEVDITQTMIDIAKADLSFKLVLQVRNKALSAYEEVMRMQL